jgi:hypothetical protein
MNTNKHGFYRRKRRTLTTDADGFGTEILTEGNEVTPRGILPQRSQRARRRETFTRISRMNTNSDQHGYYPQMTQMNADSKGKFLQEETEGF